MELPAEIVARLEATGQAHILRFWGELDDSAQRRLASEIGALDLPRLDRLVSDLLKSGTEPAHTPQDVRPIDVLRLPRTDSERIAWRHLVEQGEDALSQGEVAVLLVAGGQGTRLGFDGPKGTFPIGPVSGASLFQIHAEKVVALGRRFGRSIPLYVMTSPENHEATADFFERNRAFGLNHYRLFVQGQMPAVDREMGRILLAGPGKLALSPDGHGGTLDALAARGRDPGPSCLEEMAERGVRTIFYFQVDNPLVKVAEPGFVGLHRARDAEVSFKVVEKVEPGEKVGVVVVADGKPQVIEYSNLPAELAERRLADGSLELWAGSIAVHLFEREFVEQLVGRAELPYHRALKKVKRIDSRGALVDPAEPNAVKFEKFIFDALPLAQRFAVVEADRRVEFEPLKNATGAESPATVRQRMTELYADWLETAGARVARRADGTVAFDLEISPLFALDAAELKGRIRAGTVVDRPLHLRPGDEAKLETRQG